MSIMKLNIHLVIVIALTPVISGQNHTRGQPTVRTNRGYVRGIILSAPTGKLVDTFLGIPYARPPLGRLRFKPSEPAEPWEHVLDVTEHPETCYQKPIPLSAHIPALNKFRSQTKMSEDCLKLNLWVPTRRAAKLPVVVWFYGGGFSRGGVAVEAYDGATFATEEQVVVVSVNYRIASLGFLFLDHVEAPGNAGLYDQLQALVWVRENIAHFGGDPAQVTLVGQSAGAASVGYHLVSPVGRSLFNRAILQSGAPHAVWAFVDRNETIRNGRRLAETLGCSSSGDVSKIIRCLQKADPEEIIASEPQGEFDNIYTFKPTVDGKLIMDHPLVSLQKQQFKRTNILVGTTKDEGTMILIGLFPYFFSFRDGISFRQTDLNFALSRLLHEHSDLVHNIITHHYTDWTDTDNSKKNIAALGNIIGDLFFQCPLADVADNYAEAGSKVFKYFYTHRSSNNVWPRWAGTFHGEEILYVFGEPLNPAYNYSHVEVQLSKRIMRYWGNFVRTGNPNVSPSGTEESIRWPRYTSKGKEFLVLAPKSTTVGRSLKVKHCVFWNRLFPRLLTLNETAKNKRSCS